MSRRLTRRPLRLRAGWGDPGGIRLDRPILVVTLEGWVDAGMGAWAAIAHLSTASPSALVAAFDTEPLIDQRARRPSPASRTGSPPN